MSWIGFGDRKRLLEKVIRRAFLFPLKEHCQELQGKIKHLVLLS